MRRIHERLRFGCVRFAITPIVAQRECRLALSEPSGHNDWTMTKELRTQSLLLT